MSARIGLGFVLSIVFLATSAPAAEPVPPAAEPTPVAEPTPAAEPAPPTEEPAPAAPLEGAAPAAGGKQAAFDVLFVEWKELLTRLRGLGLEYQTADEARKAEISANYDELVRQGDVMQDPLVDAAVEAFVETPDLQGELATFLKGVVIWESGHDNFERGLALAKTLIEHDCRDQNVLALASLAAFATCELDTAEAYAKLTQETGGVDALLEVLPADHFCARSLPSFIEQIPYYREAWPKEEAIRAAEAAADDLPRVLLTTDKGEIEVELYENEAPNTVANFLSLVEAGFYDGLTFHRVLSGFMAQGGCPNGDGTGDAGCKIACECGQANHRLHFRGVLSMAKSAPPDTGGSQFFINFSPTQHLDGAHTVFGRVVRGMDVLSDLQRTNPDEQNQPDPDRILSAKVLRKRDHEYVPQKMGE